jgi:2-dehydropantoate 2-reductase
MRVAIYGTGAIGGLIAARLAEAGSQVVCIDRGSQLAAIRQSGLTLIGTDGRRRSVPVEAEASLEQVYQPDVVVLAVKAHEVAAVAAAIASLPQHVPVVTVQNGIPWWYFHGLAGAHAGTVLESVDPGGAIGRLIAAGRVIGCVAYPAAEILAPGVIRHIEGERFPLGELDGSVTERAGGIAEEFLRAGFKSPVLDDIRSEVWLKAWGNLAFNPISALTALTMAQICRFAPTRSLATAMMLEAQGVAERLDISFRVPLERRLAGAERVGDHKTSMLQDLEAHRPLEIGAILGAVIEMGEKVANVETPTLRAVEALLRAIDPGRAAAGEQNADPLLR